MVGASLALVEATHAASPALATTLAWFLRRVAAAYAAPGVSNAFAGCPSPPNSRAGQLEPPSPGSRPGRPSPRPRAARRLLLGSLASARRGALAGDGVGRGPASGASARPVPDDGGDDALTRAVSRLAPERRTDLATALADCALGRRRCIFIKCLPVHHRAHRRHCPASMYGSTSRPGARAGFI